jgi:hypothetical protein
MRSSGLLPKVIDKLLLSYTTECHFQTFFPLGNGKEYKKEYILTAETISEKGTSSSSVFDLLTKNRAVAIMTVILLYSWFVNSAAYYGLTLVAGNDRLENKNVSIHPF